MTRDIAYGNYGSFNQPRCSEKNVQASIEM